MAGTAATITMSMREVDRVKTAQAVVDRMLPTGLAAQRLGLCRRRHSFRRGACDVVAGFAGRRSGYAWRFGQLRPGDQQRWCGRRFIADVARNERRDSLAIWSRHGSLDDRWCEQRCQGHQRCRRHRRVRRRTVASFERAAPCDRVAGWCTRGSGNSRRRQRRRICDHRCRTDRGRINSGRVRSVSGDALERRRYHRPGDFFPVHIERLRDQRDGGPWRGSPKTSLAAATTPPNGRTALSFVCRAWPRPPPVTRSASTIRASSWNALGQIVGSAFNVATFKS